MKPRLRSTDVGTIPLVDPPPSGRLLGWIVCAASGVLLGFALAHLQDIARWAARVALRVAP